MSATMTEPKMRQTYATLITKSLQLLGSRAVRALRMPRRRRLVAAVAAVLALALAARRRRSVGERGQAQPAAERENATLANGRTRPCSSSMRSRAGARASRHAVDRASRGRRGLGRAHLGRRDLARARPPTLRIAASRGGCARSTSRASRPARGILWAESLDDALSAIDDLDFAAGQDRCVIAAQRARAKPAHVARRAGRAPRRAPSSRRLAAENEAAAPRERESALVASSQPRRS